MTLNLSIFLTIKFVSLAGYCRLFFSVRVWSAVAIYYAFFDRIRGDETNFNWFQSIGSASKICLNHFTWFWCVCTSWVLSITCVINGLCWVAQRTISTANKKMCSTDAWMWDLMNNTIGLNKEFCDSLNVLDWTFAPFLLPIRHHRCHYIRTHTHILKRCTMTFLYHR